MKRLNLKSLWLMLVMLCISLHSVAYSFVVDGIYYDKVFNSSTGEYDCVNVTYLRDWLSSDNSSAYTGDVVIPESVTYDGQTYPVKGIKAYAFASCSNVTSVTIPNSVTSIGSGAFDSCLNLTSVIIPNSVTSIGVSAFNYCQRLTSVTIPNSVTSIDYATFCNTGLTSVTIPNSVTSIGDQAFENCSGLTSVTIPNSVTSIGDQAFENCSGLTSVTIPNSVTSIGRSAFYGCSGLTSVTIPNSVTSIEYQAFRNCSGLTSVTIPNSVTSIGSYAFYGCSGLTSVTIGNSVKSIGSYAFYNCSGLTSVTIPNSVTSIGGSAFENCSGLTSVTIPNSVTSIGDAAFSRCSGLTSVTIPNSVTSIGGSAFENCSGLTSVTIPNSVTSIGGDAFTKALLILESETPATVGSMESGVTFIVPDNALDAYKSAPVWTDMQNRISAKSKAILDVTTYAADGQLKLAEAVGIGNEQSVASLKLHGTLNGYDLMVIRNKMKNLRILDLSDVSIVADEGYEYYPGCKITDNVLGNHVFYDMENLLSIVMPKDITSIGESAFQRCLGLVSVSGIPESCTSIGGYAFSNCADLRKIILPNSVTKIDNGAFYMCKSLNEIILSNSITTIGEDVFEYCSSLSEITLPNSVTRIGNNAFRNCSGLKKIKFSENLKTIGSDTFRSCSSLVELKLPSSLEYIGGNAFLGCTGLSAIHLPSMLTSISYGAFENCGKKDVYVYTLSPISISMDTFNFDGVLHAPQEPYSVFFDYYTDTQWSQFANVVPFEAKYSSWYMGEDQDITLNDGETIPNEDEEQAEGEMAPGSGLNYQDGAYQWLDKLNLKWKEGHAPSLIDNSSVFVDKLIFTLDVKAGKWYFFCFPFDIELDKAKFNGKYVWRYYDGDERASNGVGGWKNIGGNKLNKFQGYIFQTNKSGEIELTINDPVFTGADKDVTVESHPSNNTQDAGWNFIGNPNLSHYDLSCFIDNFNCPITVWDPVNGTYNAIVPGDDDYTFSPFEAFFVQKPTGTNAMTFEAENRETGNQAKTSQNAKAMSRMTKAINPERLIVNLTISNGQTEDKTRVVFNDKKSLFYDEGCDAGKFLSTENVPQIYTIDGKNVKYAINERPNSGNIVKLGYKASAEGTYTICAKRMDCQMAIKDTKTGITHNFSDGDYEFTSDAGTFDDRFVLMPSSEATGIKSLQAAGIVVESGNGYIALGGLNGKTASVYGANGMMVATISDNGRIDIAAGAYIIKVGDNSSKVVVK